MEAVLSQLLGMITAVVVFILGYRTGRGKETKNIFYCGYIETIPVDPDNPFKIQAEPCCNPASVIIGGRTLCEDHTEAYISDMTLGG